MDLLKKNKYLAGVLIALSYCVLVLPVTEAAWFDIEYLKQDQLLFSTITKGLFFLTLTAISIFALHFIEKVRNKDQFYRTWLMYSGLYAGLMAIILLFIWPGYWQWDELDVLNASQHYDIFSWQSIHTQLQYIFSLYILPFMTGITILQILAVSFISGYIVARVKKIITRKKLLYLLLIPLTLSPVIILSNFYTLRTQLLAYLILLLLFKLLLLVQERAAHISNKYVTFIGFSFLIALISTWRSENIVYLPILIFLWFYLGLYRSLKKQWKATLASTVGSLVIVVFFFGLSRFTADPSYSMTINLNTLQMIVHSDLKEGAEKDLAAINKSIDVEILKKYPSYCDIDSFWYGTRDYDTPLLRKDWQKKDNIESYKRGVFSLFLHNPGPFMTYRLKTYLATNFMDKDAPGRCNMSINTGQFITNHAAESAHIHGLSRSFLDANALNRSPNPDMRTNILRFLVATDAQWLRPFIWNVTPALLLCLVILLHSLLRRRFYWTLAMLILFAHTLLIFLSAPAPMFMYYFPLYLSGTILPLIYIILRLNERGSSPKNTKNTL